MLFNDKDITLIYGVINFCKFLREHETELNDWNKAWDTPTTGFKDRLAAMPNGGQDALNELYSGLPEGAPFTVAQLNDLAHLTTTLVKADVADMSHALTVLWKL